MTPDDLKQIKNRIENTLKKRSGIGAVDMYTGPEYALGEFKRDEPITAEAGIKTIDLLLKITGCDPNREIFPELGSGSRAGEAMPAAFNVDDINRICDELDADLKDKNRGGFRGWRNGKFYDIPGGMDGKPDTGNTTEINHCNASCTGICVGSCIGMCNGCTGCESTCSANSTSYTESGGWSGAQYR